MREITVTIKPGGKTIVETSGFQGESCLAATRGLLQALGMADAPMTPKPEMQDVPVSTDTSVDLKHA